MLDEELLAQLRETFSRLEGAVNLRVASVQHENQAELQGFLQNLTAASDKISMVIDPAFTAKSPHFEVVGASRRGVFFTGIPGGHEFSSLVLAILYCDGKGKLPDPGIVARVQRLKVPTHLKTYVSLSCENCPEVVQALSLMASLHPGLTHEMVDGAYAENEIAELGIQGVPSVVLDGKLIHSGKSTFLDLLKKLEEIIGTSDSKKSAVELGLFDVAVIGGGPAGVSAAIYSARKGMKTALVSDHFGGQVKETKGIENMISIPYTEGPKLVGQMADHLRSYPVDLFDHRRVTAISGDKVKLVQLESGESLQASAVIIATGAKWRELGVPGEKEHIGLGVAFCAHCDGPFYKGKKVAVVGGGNSGVEAAIDLAGIVNEVVLLEYGDTLRADKILLDKLAGQQNASVILHAKTTRVVGDLKHVTALEYIDHKTNTPHTLAVDGVFVQIGLLPNTQWARDLVKLNARGEVVVDDKGRTSQPGIYAAGDVTPIPFKQIVTSMGDGAKVALTVFEDRLRH